MKSMMKSALCLILVGLLLGSMAACKPKSQSEEWGIVPKNYKVEVTDVKSQIDAENVIYYQTSVNYGFSVFVQDGKYGLLSFDGTVLHDATYLTVEPWEREPDGAETALVAMHDDGSWVWLAEDGTESPAENLAPHNPKEQPKVFWDEPEGKPILYLADQGIVNCTYENYNNAFHSIWSLGSYAYEAPKKIAVPSVSAFTTTVDENGEYSYTAVKSTDRYGIFDLETGTMCTGFIYEFASPLGFKDGILPVCMNGQWSYMTEDGNLICDYIFDTCLVNMNGNHEVYSIVNGYAVIHKEDLYGLISSKGEWATEMRYTAITQVNPQGFFWAKEAADSPWTLMQVQHK